MKKRVPYSIASYEKITDGGYYYVDKTAYIRERIRESFQQAEAIERALAATLGVDIHENTFGCGRLVE